METSETGYDITPLSAEAIERLAEAAESAGTKCQTALTRSRHRTGP